MVSLRFFFLIFFFKKSMTDFMVTIAAHNQKKRKMRVLLVTKEFLSSSELRVSLQVLYKIPSGLRTLCVFAVLVKVLLV